MSRMLPRSFPGVSPLSVAIAIFLMLPFALSAQNRIGTGAAADLYAVHCKVCHGKALEGGLGANLIDGEWKHGNSDAEVASIIKNGLLDQGMSSFKSVLSDEQIRSLVIYIREVAQLQRKGKLDERLRPKEGIYTTEQHRFRIEEMATLDGVLWSMVFMPDESMLVAERGGVLYHLKAGEISRVENIPEVRARGQGGLMEVALHPDYAKNGWIYLGLVHRASHSGNDDLGMTQIVRGKIEDGRWTSGQTIYCAPVETYLPTNHHFGTRIVFQDGYLFFSIGDRGRQDMAQDLTKPNGKIHRLHDNGRVPADNPFVGQAGALPSIWSYGHRNPQGMDAHPVTGDLWSTEHGPRGGDEINLVRRGRNYGWPVITYGMNYNGSPITNLTTKAGMEQPAHYWTPSIAVCGIDFYEGERFPLWKNDLFVTGLASEELHRLVVQEKHIVADEIVLKNAGRVRDVASGPDGLLYVVLMNGDRKTGRICRLVPLD